MTISIRLLRVSFWTCQRSCRGLKSCQAWQIRSRVADDLGEAYPIYGPAGYVEEFACLRGSSVLIGIFGLVHRCTNLCVTLTVLLEELLSQKARVERANTARVAVVERNPIKKPDLEDAPTYKSEPKPKKERVRKKAAKSAG